MLKDHFRKSHRQTEDLPPAPDKARRRAEVFSPVPDKARRQTEVLSPVPDKARRQTEVLPSAPDRTCRQTEKSLSPLAVRLRSLLAQQGRSRRTPVVLCIGTDRIIGDSLGPLVGSKLTEAGLLPYIYGTLDTPVHALNLQKTLNEIKKRHPSSTVIAVDASLGSKSGIGSISVRDGGLHPGAGVSKNLCLAGDISITGITNMEDGCPLLSLQTARLSTVMQMAEQIAECILEACTS